uniref:Uncharacterized protein n=1 Tax=Tanacetum cinerariifolium TaxID=118510 RepID=A0A699H1S0_TANCI|nr:hypothetical protein [Tanacetum cinerariifolium]
MAAEMMGVVVGVVFAGWSSDEEGGVVRLVVFEWNYGGEVATWAEMVTVVECVGGGVRSEEMVVDEGV